MIKGSKQHKYCYISKDTVQALILSLTMEQKTHFYKLLDDHIATLNAKEQESFCVTQAKYAKMHPRMLIAWLADGLSLVSGK